jgi:hypothetical protein
MRQSDIDLIHLRALSADDRNDRLVRLAIDTPGTLLISLSFFHNFRPRYVLRLVTNCRTVPSHCGQTGRPNHNLAIIRTKRPPNQIGESRTWMEPPIVSAQSHYRGHRGRPFKGRKASTIPCAAIKNGRRTRLPTLKKMVLCERSSTRSPLER